MNIGNAILKLRKQRGISQIDLASKTGITQTTLSQIERGHSKANNKTIEKLCNEFNVHESYLMFLGIEESDVPVNKKEIFDTLYPLLLKCLEDK